jgi:hypothetical protein
LIKCVSHVEGRNNTRAGRDVNATILATVLSLVLLLNTARRRDWFAVSTILIQVFITHIDSLHLLLKFSLQLFFVVNYLVVPAMVLTLVQAVSYNARNISIVTNLFVKEEIVDLLLGSKWSSSLDRHVSIFIAIGIS